MYLFENWKETYLSYRGKINYASNREAIRLIVKMKMNKLVYIYYLPRISYSLKTALFRFPLWDPQQYRMERVLRQLWFLREKGDGERLIAPPSRVSH